MDIREDTQRVRKQIDDIINNSNRIAATMGIAFGLHRLVGEMVLVFKGASSPPLEIQVTVEMLRRTMNTLYDSLDKVYVSSEARCMVQEAEDSAMKEANKKYFN